MIGKIEFPEGVTYNIRYITGGDFLGPGCELEDLSYFYAHTKNTVIFPQFDTSKVTSMSSMFSNCSSLPSIPHLDTSKVTSMSYMFNGCSVLTSIPQLDTSNVKDMTSIFNGCKALTSIPQLNTQNVTIMNNMFYGCTALTTIPQLDVSNVTGATNMFRDCRALTSIPDLNFTKLTGFGGGSSYSWLYGCSALQSIGVIDCDANTNVGYGFGNSTNNNLTHLGGFRNLGKASSVSNTNGTAFMAYAPNLTYESVMNVINLLYDRAANGLSTLTLKLHANHMALLSDDDKAIATNKGWSLTS